MAKIFGYNYRSLSGQVKLALEDMGNAFSIGFKLHELIKNSMTGMGVGVLGEHDCQPILLRNDNIDLVFMGKIFNIKKEQDIIFENILGSIGSDNRILLKDALRKINGIFIMFIFDSQNNRVFIINDRYGMEPLYYYKDRNKLLFASEIKAILTDQTIEREVNWNFWKDFFQYGFGIGNKTPFDNIFNLLSASILVFQDGDLEISRYWDYYEIKVNHGLSEEEAIDTGARVLKNVFTRQSADLDECMVFLSGGYDSRCISSALKHFTNVSFENYSTSLHPSGEIESTLAKKVSDKLGIKNNYVGKIRNLYQDYFNNHIIQIDGLCTEHMWIQPLVGSIENCVANFDGIGGDVLLKNVSASKKNIGQYRDNDKIVNLLNKEMIAYWSGESCQNIYKYFDHGISEKIKPGKDSLRDEVYSLGDSENKIIIFYLLNRTRNVAQLAARHLIARKVYSYFPFFDNEFVEYSLSLPSEMKYFDYIYYKILKRVFPKIMEVPTTNDKTIKLRIHNTLTGLLGWKNFSRILSIYKKILLTLDPRTLYGEDMRYLRNSLKVMNMPPFVDRDGLVARVDSDIRSRNNPIIYLTKVLQFCSWYNEYFSAKK